MQKVILKIILLFILFSPTVILADFKISEYKFYKEIIPREKKSGDFYISLDKDIYKNSRPFFLDLRIVDKNNKEEKYFLWQEKEIIIKNKINIPLKVISKKENVFLIDREDNLEYISSINIETDSIDFARVVDVYGSNLKNSRYEKLSEDSGNLILYSPAQKKLSINFKYTKYRFLKLVILGDEGELEIENFYIEKEKIENKEGKKELYNLDFKNISQEKDTENRRQRFLLTNPFENYPLNYLILKTKEKDFSRKIHIYSSNKEDALFLENKKRYNSKKEYWKKEYSGNFIKKVYYDNQKFKVNENKKYYLIIIENEDNESLNITGAKGERYLDLVYLNNLDFNNNSYKIYYGSLLAKKPLYDFSNFNKKIDGLIGLGEEKNNPLYKEPVQKISQKMPYLIYFFISLLILILSWFVYKILKEDNQKDLEKKSFIKKL